MLGSRHARQFKSSAEQHLVCMAANACVRACVRVCVHACVCVCVCVREGLVTMAAPAANIDFRFGFSLAVEPAHIRACCPLICSNLISGQG
mmetsp:Transcript_103416/g.297068  ORF Transcript_103416/g.297068 Transcript_103416/m.297068 type:complete len:91 (+) Transcript_103416:814-1086(+)